MRIEGLGNLGIGELNSQFQNSQFQNLLAPFHFPTIPFPDSNTPFFHHLTLLVLHSWKHIVKINRDRENSSFSITMIKKGLKMARGEMSLEALMDFEIEACLACVFTKERQDSLKAFEDRKKGIPPAL